MTARGSKAEMLTTTRSRPLRPGKTDMREQHLARPVGVVEKVFSVSQRETLIQNPAQERNADSRNDQPGFNYFQNSIIQLPLGDFCNNICQ
jgi:hypothetical protein